MQFYELKSYQSPTRQYMEILIVELCELKIYRLRISTLSYQKLDMHQDKMSN